MDTALTDISFFPYEVRSSLFLYKQEQDWCMNDNAVYSLNHMFRHTPTKNSTMKTLHQLE